MIYEVNNPMVSAEAFDEETIIIHFDTGNYYSLDSFSTIVWKAIENRVDITSMPEMLSEYFKNTSSEELHILLNQLVAELLREDLIRPSMCDSPGTTELQSVKICDELPKDAGCLTKFDDLQELLLLDPIHDVDEAGWPHAQSPEKQDTDR
jgi:hypothetical protein